MLLTIKLVSQLLLPPGILILLAALALLFWQRLWARVLLSLVLATFWLLSTEPVRDALSKPLEYRYAAYQMDSRNLEHTAIVLLGGGVYANAPEYEGQDALNSYAMMRTIYAAYLAKETGLVVYATGGKPINKNNDAEADVMKRWLLDLGVVEQAIRTESFANNTWQNAVYIKKQLSKVDVQRILLVTSAWHMPRSVWCFASQDLEVIAAPTDYITSQQVYDLRSYLPQASVFASSVLALHEYLGLLWYYIKYG